MWTLLFYFTIFSLLICFIQTSLVLLTLISSFQSPLWSSNLHVFWYRLWNPRCVSCHESLAFKLQRNRVIVIVEVKKYFLSYRRHCLLGDCLGWTHKKPFLDPFSLRSILMSHRIASFLIEHFLQAAHPWLIKFFLFRF